MLGFERITKVRQLFVTQLVSLNKKCMLFDKENIIITDESQTVLHWFLVGLCTPLRLLSVNSSYQKSYRLATPHPPPNITSSL